MGYTATPYRYLFRYRKGTGQKLQAAEVTGAAGTAAGFAFGLLRFRENEIKGR